MTLPALTVVSIPPNWASGITETLEWQTAILASPIGAEQRFSLRRTPRRSFELPFVINGRRRARFDLLMLRAGGSDVYLPLWHDRSKLVAPLTVGGTSLSIGDTSYTEFADSPGVFIRGPDPWNYEIGEYASQDGSHVNLTAGVANGWPAGTSVYPLIRARVETQPTATRMEDRTFQVSVKFSATQPNPISSAITLTEYAGQFVLEREPNSINDLSFQYARQLAELDNQTGLRYRVDLNPYGTTIQQFAFYNRGRADNVWLRTLFYTLAGRRIPILVPTFLADFDLAAPLATSTMTVFRSGFTDFAGPFRGRRQIQIRLRDGTRLYREITGSALVGDGATESIALNAGFTPPIPISSVQRISYLTASRLDQDAIEIVHQTDTKGLSTCTTVFREIAAVRNPIGDPPGDGKDDGEVFGGNPNALYFEFEVLAANSSHAICIGIANSDFTLNNPVNLDVFTDFPAAAGGALVSLAVGGGYGGIGYPDKPPAPGITGLNQWIGVLVLLDAKQMFTCNASVTPDVWTTGGPTTDPEVPVGGFDFSSNITHGPVFICGGCGWENFGTNIFPRGTLNAAGPFVRTTPIPRNGIAWGSASWNSGDSDPDSHIIGVDSQTFTCDEITSGTSGRPYLNQPTAFIRSTTSKVLPP